MRTVKQIEKEHKQFWEEYKNLPPKDRKLIAEQAVVIVESLVDDFTKKLSEAKEFTGQTKLLAIEKVWGITPDMTEEEANDDNSVFSRKFNVALRAAICEIMRDKKNAKNN
jgi:hypothetical protein